MSTSKDTDDLVSWRQLAPIFADIAVSPSNILVGCLLIQSVSAWNALASILIGQAILAVVFILYGGLGYSKRMLASEILCEVFGDKFSKYVISTMLACGQIGWTAINVGLGGTSLAMLTHLPIWLGITIYGLLLGTMTGLNFYKLAAVKMTIVISSISLVVCVIYAKLLHTSFLTFLAYQPTTSHPLLWGISIMVASYIAFATVTPNFFIKARHKSDVVKATFAGLVAPGIVVALVGCFLFFDQHSYNLNALLVTFAIPFLPSILNIITNTDGSIALYTPALTIVSFRPMSFKVAAFIAAAISIALALFHIVDHLAIWLAVLSLMSPILIGVAFAAVLFNETSAEPLKQFVRAATYWVYGTTFAICAAVAVTSQSVLIALVAPLILYSAYLHYRFMRQ